MKWRIRRIFSIESLRRILRISLRLHRSSWCGGLAASNGGSWWPLVVVGGGEGGVRVWVAFWREGESENRVFTLKNIFILCRSHLASSSHLASLSH